MLDPPTLNSVNQQVFNCSTLFAITHLTEGTTWDTSGWSEVWHTSCWPVSIYLSFSVFN